MEEAAEVVWGQFLEAENAAVQFKLNGFNQRENEFRLKLDNCIKLLNSKDASIEKLNSRITQLVADNLEVSVLREQVKSLEEKVNESESNLKKANESNELFQERVTEMESIIESLKDDVYTAENRAETADAKVVELTDSNNELSEELIFLKRSHEIKIVYGKNILRLRESSYKNMSLLEKQSRDLEIQAQHAKASSEAGQEQQNMLYSAIWDMETLIDELKQKVSVAEMKAENAEEQCLLLTDNISELTKEVEFLRAEVESLETPLSNANLEKMASMKDINAKTKVIMDTVLQLAKERERITKQLHTQTEEKRILTEILRNINKDVYANTYPKGGIQEKNTTFSGQDATLNEKSAEFIKDEEIQVLNDASSIHDGSPESSITDSDPNLDDTELEEPEYRSKRMLVFRAIFVLSISVLAAFFINWKPDSFDVNVG